MSLSIPRFGSNPNPEIEKLARQLQKLSRRPTLPRVPTGQITNPAVIRQIKTVQIDGHKHFQLIQNQLSKKLQALRNNFNI